MDTTSETPDGKRALLRHCLATLAYRGGKAVRAMPPELAGFQARPGTRTPQQILAHVGDLLAWAVSIAQGRQVWQASEPLPWEQEVGRFFDALRQLDAVLASSEPLHAAAERLFQGPIADALTHIGQISLLRRMSGAPVRGENYYKAEIRSGLVGPDQPRAVFEFD
jgi:hypothetical protein